MLNNDVKKQNGENNANNKIKNQFFQPNNWYYSKRKIKLEINDNINIFSTKDKVNYISLFENNTKFNRVPKQVHKFEVKDGTYIKIIGNKSADLKVTFYLIEYDKKKQLQVNRLFLNKEYKINKNPNTEYFRFAIRIEGIGNVNITDIELYKSKIQVNEIKESYNTKKAMKDIKIACIFDEFSMNCFSDTATLIPFTPDDFQHVISTNKPDLLMIESAWQGNFGTWRYEIASYNINKNHKNLKKVIQYCNELGIPTVFWNKEDPIHFEAFIGAASLFDYVLTTDANQIEQYKERLKHDRVYAMQFAANPKAHNPILPNKRKINKISFAGSYYGNRHEERRKDMNQMLRVCKTFGLDIYDRNYELNKKGKTDFSFPEEFQENVVGSLKYQQIDKAYKDYKVILNVNSVKNSPTMFSRRVFEGLACGTPIISSYSKGIEETFGDIVLISEDENELKKSLNELLTNMKTYREVAIKGIREVFRHHTYRNRLEFILNTLNIPTVKEDDSLTVLMLVENMDEFNLAKELIKEQSLNNFKTIIIVSEFDHHEKLIEENKSEELTVHTLSSLQQYDSVQEFVSTSYVTIMSLQHEYGVHYLEDLMHAAHYSYADIIGKKSLFDGENYDYGKFEYEYVDSVIKDTAIYKTDILKNVDIKTLLCDENLINELFAYYGAKVFSADQFNIRLEKIYP